MPHLRHIYITLC